MRNGKTTEQALNAIRQPYQAWATGDGAKTEFPLPKNVGRPDDLRVLVGGAGVRPSDRGTAHDYAIRGHTPGYAGDTNTVKFTTPPGAGVAISFIVNAA